MNQSDALNLLVEDTYTPVTPSADCAWVRQRFQRYLLNSLFNSKWTGFHWAHHRLGKIKVDLTFWPIARDCWGLNWKIPVHEEGSMYDVSLGYRGCWFQELPQISAAPAVQLEKSREPARLKTLPPPALCVAQDRKLTRILTGVAPDCGPPCLVGLLPPSGL
jgi:hypothetical protein